MSIDVTDERWYAGLTLLERHASLPHEGNAGGTDGQQTAGAGEGPDARDAAPPDEETPAASREVRWRRAAPFARAGSFERRLAADGLWPERFRTLVTSPIGQVRQALPEQPEWLRLLADALEHGPGLEMPPCGEGPGDGDEGRRDEGLRDEGQGGVPSNAFGLLRGVRPLMAQAFALFREGLTSLLAQYPDGPVSREVGEQVFLTGLARQVLGLVGRTLVLELNVARVNGTLRGETAAQRFRSFIEGLDDAAAPVTLLREYPVLARMLTTILTARAEARLECLRHLCEDWPAIRSRWPQFAARVSTGQGRVAEVWLAGVSASLGDPHRGGRTVLMLRFEPAGALVYKPRSLAADVHFQELLAWLNARGAAPAFRTLDILDCGHHGWMEAVSVAPCGTRVEVARFYERLGALLALLYALEATDCHFENLVASGEHPVLVDLEALFHPRGESPLENTAQGLAVEALGRSVLRVGLLPQRIWSRAGFAGIDLSGCGGEPGQRLPQKVPTWEAPGTDEMRLVEQDGTLPSSSNRPSLLGQPLDALEEAPAIERGFVRMYRLLSELRPLLLAEDGPIRRFAHDRVRAILRPTRTYGLLLHECTHPDVLRDGLDRDRLFDWLWADADRQPSLAWVIHAERHDLERGDVPCFTTTPSSRAIWTSTGEELQYYEEATGLTRVIERLQAMNEIDLERQRWFLRASLTSLARTERRPMVIAHYPVDPHGTSGLMPGARRSATPGHAGLGVAALAPPASPDEFVEAAARAAHRLRTLAFIDGVRASWIGLTVLAEERWSLVPLGLDLYGGLPGIALFLARLASVTESPRHRLLAEQTVEGMLEQIEPQRGWPLIGAFSGWGGTIYALAHLGPLLQHQRYVDRAMALVPRVAEHVRGDAAFDVIGGSAGAIMGLAALQAVRPSDEILATIEACAKHLVAYVDRQPIGCGWWTSLPSSAPLLGFSHGAGGISLALLTAASLTAHAAAHYIGCAGIEYERGHFAASTKNWPDLRLVDAPDEASTSSATKQSAARAAPPQRFMTTWCHGAPGILLARVAGLRYVDDWRVRMEIAEAVRATMRAGFGANHCLCHGDLGNLECLAVTAARLGDVGLRRDVAQIAAGLLHAIDERGWRCGVPLDVETPGFMMGLAGIGDGLLRIGAPDLPSILMLEPPPTRRVPMGGHPLAAPPLVSDVRQREELAAEEGTSAPAVEHGR